MYDNVPEVKAAMDADDCCIGTVDSWIIYNLTGGVTSGVHVTDGAILQTFLNANAHLSDALAVLTHTRFCFLPSRDTSGFVDKIPGEDSCQVSALDTKHNLIHMCQALLPVVQFRTRRGRA